jgi:predicted MFS family arabinose efflux permease
VGSSGGRAALGSVLLFFTGAGALYAYLERVGAGAGLSSVTVSSSIAASNIAGWSGSLMASIVARAVGRRRGAAVGGALALSAMLAFCTTPLSAVVFLVASCTFMFAWNVFFPFQFDRWPPATAPAPPRRSPTR